MELPNKTSHSEQLIYTNKNLLLKRNSSRIFVSAALASVKIRIGKEGPGVHGEHTSVFFSSLGCKSLGKGESLSLFLIPGVLVLRKAVS